MNSTMRQGGVLTIILTHSSPRTLSACVAAVRGQTCPPGHVLVVDNDGDPPASATLFGQAGVEVVRRTVNDGPAGGWEFALAEFLNRDEKWVWLLDDDVVPAPDCLEQMLRDAWTSDSPTVLWPRIRQWWGEPHDYPGWCGVLLAREVVETIGLPRGELVWWAEDTEYLQRRVGVAGFEARTVEAALVVHGNARDEPVMPPWMMYYQVRNTIYYRVYVQRLIHPFRLTRSLTKSLGAALVPPGPRWARLRRYLHGAVDGITGRLGLRVELGS